MFRVVLLVSVGLVLFFQATPPVPTKGTAVVAGQVIDGSTGRPVGGAVVTLAIGGLPPAGSYGFQPLPAAQSRRGVAVANADGRFVFRDVPAGTFSLVAALDGYAAGASGRRRPGGPSRTFTVADGARITDAVINVWRLASVSGMVRDDRDDPAVGIYVTVMARVLTAGREEFTFVGGSGESTDDRGFYRVSNLMPGSYMVTIRGATQTAPVATVDAYRAAVTSGSTASVMPAPGQTGALMLSRSGLIVGDWQVSVSEGNARPLLGPKGSLLVHPPVYHPNARVPAEAGVLILGPGDDRTGVDLLLPLITGVTVSGLLTGPDGPAASHGLRLVPVSDTGPIIDLPVAYSTTDAAGRFAFHGVTPGAYVARAYRVTPSGPALRFTPPAAGAPPIDRVEGVAPKPGVRPPSLFAEVPVTVGASNVDGVPIVLRPGARIAGRVAFEGAALAPPAARLEQITLAFRPLVGTVPGEPQSPDGAAVGGVRVDAEGRFATNGYPPGRYVFLTPTPPTPEWTLSSIHVGGVDVTTQPLTLGDSNLTDVEVTFTDKVISLSGAVQAATGSQDNQATVILFPVDIQGWMKTGMSVRRLVIGPTSASGDYQLRVPLPGDYLVVAIPPEVAPDVDANFLKRYAAGAIRISLAAGESRTQPLTVSRPR